MKRHHYLLGYIFAAAMIAGLAFTSASAQTDKKYAPPSLTTDRSKPAPRTADGHPDLSGMWVEKFGALGTDPAVGKPERTRPAGPGAGPHPRIGRAGQRRGPPARRRPNQG